MSEEEFKLEVIKRLTKLDICVGHVETDLNSHIKHHWTITLVLITTLIGVAVKLTIG